MATMNLKTVLTALCLAASAAANPIQKRDNANTNESTCSAGRPVKVRMSEVHNIYPQNPQLVGGTPTGLEVRSLNGESYTEQINVFRNIPRGASNCELRWDQGTPEGRVFVTRGSPAIDVHQLSGLPTDEGLEMTFESVQPYVNEPRIGSPDFTMWDAELRAVDHSSNLVECAEELFFKMSLFDTTTNTHMYLRNDATSGFYLQYNC